MAAPEDASPPRLPELFEASRKLVDEVEAATEPTGSRAVQDKVARGLALLERAAAMLAQLGLFGRGEALEDAASADLRYLLVPALRGALTLRLAEPGRRAELLRRARGLFMDFLTRCQACRVADFALPPPADADADARPSLLAMAARRQAKVLRDQRTRAAERGLAALRAAVEGGAADEERVREYRLLQLRRWVGVSLEEVESIDRELRLLGGQAAPGGPHTLQTPRAPPARPFVLARRQAAAAVFGPGYPSLATATVSDWYERRRERWLGSGAAQPRQGEEPQEEPEEREGEGEALRRARHWDDWKDGHPRGYGNRHNMG